MLIRLNFPAPNVALAIFPPRNGVSMALSYQLVNGQYVLTDKQPFRIEPTKEG